MTTHILDDSRAYETNADRRMICGIVGKLPDGDQFWYPSEYSAGQADCPVCNPGGPRRMGTPISELTGRNGGNAEWRRISESWGYD
jgi:hypothetical protein